MKAPPADQHAILKKVMLIIISKSGEDYINLYGFLRSNGNFWSFER
jgi:hypothetical protein